MQASRRYEFGRRKLFLGSVINHKLDLAQGRAVSPPNEPSIASRHKFLKVSQTQLALSMSSTTNSFGHDRFNPVFLAIEPVQKGGRPPVLTRLANRLPQLYEMLTKAQWRAMTTFRISRNRRTPRQRQIYSQRREAVVRLLQAMVTSLDLKTMAILCPDGRTGRLEAVTLSWLAQRAGLGLKRADRAMADIESMGLVFVKQRRESSQDGEWRSKAAIRRVNKLLFSVLGLGDELDKARKYKNDRLRLGRERSEQVDDRTQTEKARDVLRTHNMMNGAVGLPSANSIQRAPNTYSPDPDDTEHYRKMALKQIRILKAKVSS